MVARIVEVQKYFIINAKFDGGHFVVFHGGWERSIE
jgi:hypothetical protein